MHVVDLVEVAALVAYQGPVLIVGTGPLAPAAIEQYWATSKCRFQNWQRNLKLHASLAADGAAIGPHLQADLRASLEEIFVSEVLTRVWTAVLVAHDQRLGTSIEEPLARNVFESHQEARQRALKILLHSRFLSTAEAVAVNRIRRRAERWSDVLVGGLLDCADLTEFAVDPTRAVDFAGDLSRRRGLAGGRHAWRLTMLALRSAFQSGLSAQAANPDANARLTASILGCFPGELFDSTGLAHSLWMTRLTAISGDVHGLIDGLIQPPRSRGWQGATGRIR